VTAAARAGVQRGRPAATRFLTIGVELRAEQKQ
jgi:hypothetical protein